MCTYVYVCLYVYSCCLYNNKNVLRSTYFKKKVKSENCLSVMNEMKNVDHAGW